MEQLLKRSHPVKVNFQLQFGFWCGQEEAQAAVVNVLLLRWGRVGFEITDFQVNMAAL